MALAEELRNRLTLPAFADRLSLSQAIAPLGSAVTVSVSPPPPPLLLLELELSSSPPHPAAGSASAARPSARIQVKRLKSCSLAR